ncbi:MAG: 6-hydroxymethylpterin diphosphokinase MptE-like protein [Colwellia sp.]
MKNENKISERIVLVEEELEKLKQNSPYIQEYEAALQKLADTMSLLVSSDDNLISRFKDNLSAFEKYHPQIYKFFKDYIPEKYIVDATDGFVNAINVETGQPFYPYPSLLSTQLQFDNFTQSPNIKEFNFNVLDENEAEFIHVDYLDSILALLPKKNDGETKKTRSTTDQLSSLIIFGVGTGYHLEMFARSYNIACLYIIEPDLDLLFLSLFSINWQFVLNTFDKKGCQIHISLGPQEDTFFDDLMTKSAMNGRYQMANVAGYIHYQSDDIDKLLNEFNRRYLEMGQGWGFFDDAVMAIGHTLGNIKNKVPLLKKCAVNNIEYADLPVFIVGNGPSLDESIDTIKALQNKAIIISCGSALSALYKYGIKPDFHCEQERTFPVAEKIALSCPNEFLDNIVLLAPTTVHPAVFSMFKRSIMAAKAHEPSSSLLLRDKVGAKLFEAYHFINPTVANTALVMGYNLGFKSFYLFGIDLGHKQDGHHHSKKSMYYNEDEKDLDLYPVDTDKFIEVDGNFGGKFICDSFFNQSNTALSRQILAFDDLHCFNLSDGAVIKGSAAMKVNQLKVTLDEALHIDKVAVINKVSQDSGYVDDILFDRLVTDLDYQYFDDVCQRLITLNSEPVNNFNEAKALLLNNTVVMEALTQHAHSLLIGTILHMQVVLTQLLYSSLNTDTAVENFNKGMVFYCQFIGKAATYYKENAEQAHYIEDNKWIAKLKNSK